MTKALIVECPSIVEISPDGYGSFKYYSGQWYFKSPPPLTKYKMIDGILAMGLGGDLVSAARDFSEHKLPLIVGSRAFYIEFESRISDNDPDHWPALWLMPIQHNQRQDDVYAGDPPKYERFMELDVDEGGFTSDMMGTVLSWEGVWPNYTRNRSAFQPAQRVLDRTAFHKFGAYFDPIAGEVSWWLDDNLQARAGGRSISPAAKFQDFYIIASAQSHGKNKEYDMYLRSIRVFVAPR